MSILVVDDDVSIRTWLKQELAASGHPAQIASCGQEAIELARRHPPRIAFVDQRMPGLDGIATVQALLREHPHVLAYLFTAFILTEQELDRAFRAGFAGYLQKPVEPEVLRDRITTALATVPAPRFASAERLIGNSTAMQKVLGTIGKVARLEVPVVIQGETGTGKELVARAIHQQSARRLGPFEPVNCSGVPATLFEAEFFGHERGAFTGAVDRRAGLFERAHGGTLFLDEIGELSSELQAKLLRAAEEGIVPRVGGGRVPVSVRIIAATNRDLARETERGGFRADLYWRLAAITIVLPPVRERGNDIDALIDFYFDRAKRELRHPDLEFSADARSSLLRHSWPGNVREIEHRMRQIVLGASTGLVRAADLPGDLRQAHLGLQAGHFERPAGLSMREAAREVLCALEPGWIQQALRSASGNHSEAAKLLGIDPRTLYTKMRRHRIWPS